MIAVVAWQLHANLLFTDTTVTGGDTGAHVMMPAFLRSQLFPHLSGWDPGWFDGFPAYTFYFVLPDSLASLASYVIPYAVAFKLATVLGSVLMPICAWACGRLFGLPRPLPAGLAAATLPFLFDYTWTIDGGNLFSTLAGEYAYSLGVALALLFLGLYARGLRTGKGRVWASIVLALCILSHVVPAALAATGAIVLLVFELAPPRWHPRDDQGSFEGAAASSAAPTRKAALGWGVSTLVAGGLLAGWWLVPFVLFREYSTAMGYTNVTTYLSLLFPRADAWALVLAGIAVVVGVARRSRFALLFTVLGVGPALALRIDPQGPLYNVRLLPLWFLCVYLLAGWVAATALLALARWARGVSGLRPAPSAPRGTGSADASPVGSGTWADPPAASPGLEPLAPGHSGSGSVPRSWRFDPAAVSGPLLLLLGALAVVVPPFVVPANILPVTPGANQVANWAEWNYSGYQGKPAYPEYRGLMRTMASIGRRYGCGRAMWEYNADENRFGTPEALMLLPYWTNGCIDSMEGLLFESSATTPYHFLNQAELSAAPSEPMVGLPYGPPDVPLGVEHLQLLGVRYFMAFSPSIVAAAQADPSLRLIASSGPWHSLYGDQRITTTWKIFEVLDAPIVSPLRYEPAVLANVGQGQSSWLAPSVAWYDDPARWSVELAAGGEPSWPRVDAPGTHPPAIPVPRTVVRDIRQTTSSITFHVDRLRTPILVKISYFPDWHAVGAQGPWRVTPNLMVVVPTSHVVTLRYGSSPPQLLGLLATIAGVVLLVGLALARRIGSFRAPSR